MTLQKGNLESGAGRRVSGATVALHPAGPGKCIPHIRYIYGIHTYIYGTYTANPQVVLVPLESGRGVTLQKVGGDFTKKSGAGRRVPGAAVALHPAGPGRPRAGARRRPEEVTFSAYMYRICGILSHTVCYDPFIKSHFA